MKFATIGIKLIVLKDSILLIYKKSLRTSPYLIKSGCQSPQALLKFKLYL